MSFEPHPKPARETERPDAFPPLPRTAPNGGCYAIDSNRGGGIADGFSRCGAPPVATMQPSGPGEYLWRMCERHARGAESMPMGRYVERDFRVGTCGHSAHAHPDAPCPDRLGIIGALPPPGHADYGCYVPLPDVKPIPVPLTHPRAFDEIVNVTVPVMDGASVAKQLAKPESQAAIRDAIIAARERNAPRRTEVPMSLESQELAALSRALAAKIDRRMQQETDAAFRARAEAAGWRVLAPEPEPDPFHCMMDGCAGSRQQRAGAGRWCRPAVTEYSREPYWACTPCLRARLDSRDATGGFAPGNARGGWPFDGTRGPDEAAMRAAQAAPPPPKPEVPMFAKGGIREPAPTPRTDDSPTEACVSFPPAPPKFERRDPAYCGAVCGAPATINGAFVKHTPHTALCEAKHAAHGGIITCPACGCTDEYELFSSHGRCESCQIALCVEAVRRNDADREAKAAAKAIRENLPPERDPPRGWDARYSVFGGP